MPTRALVLSRDSNTGPFANPGTLGALSLAEQGQAGLFNQVLEMAVYTRGQEVPGVGSALLPAGYPGKRLGS